MPLCFCKNTYASPVSNARSSDHPKDRPVATTPNSLRLSTVDQRGSSGLAATLYKRPFLNPAAHILSLLRQRRLD